MPSPLITVLLGCQIAAFSGCIVSTLINTFKHYPYLLQGEYDYTIQYFNEITTSTHGGLTLATVDNTFAGFLIGCPLQAREEQFADAFETLKKSTLAISDYYYFSDVVVLPEFKKQKIATQLFTQFEEQAKSWGYKGTCLFVIQCNENHPLKPVQYQDLESFYKKLGYTKTTIQSTGSWPTILDANGTVAMKEHTLMFWIKDFKTDTNDSHL